MNALLTCNCHDGDCTSLTQVGKSKYLYQVHQGLSQYSSRKSVLLEAYNVFLVTETPAYNANCKIFINSYSKAEPLYFQGFLQTLHKLPKTREEWSSREEIFWQWSPDLQGNLANWGVGVWCLRCDFGCFPRTLCYNPVYLREWKMGRWG